MNKQNILYGIIGLLAGFIIGFFFANGINRNAARQPASSQTGISGNLQMQTSADIKEAPNNGGGGAMMPEVTQTLKKAEDEPNNFEAQMQAGLMYLRIQNTEKAAEYFQRAVNARKDTFEDLTALGNAFFDIRNFEEAEKWYTLALEKNPDDVNVRTDLGSTFIERPQPDLNRAIKEYRTSLSKEPAHESTLYNLALAQMRNGDSQGAQETFNQLQNVNPNSPLIPKLKEKLAQPAVQK